MSRFIYISGIFLVCFERNMNLLMTNDEWNKFLESPGDTHTLLSAKMSQFFCLLFNYTHMLYLYFIYCMSLGLYQSAIALRPLPGESWSMITNYTPVNWWQDYGHARLIHIHGDQTPACLVWSYTKAKLPKKDSAGHHRKAPEHPMPHNRPGKEPKAVYLESKLPRSQAQASERQVQLMEAQPCNQRHPKVLLRTSWIRCQHPMAQT